MYVLEAGWSCPPLALETRLHCGVEGSGYNGYSFSSEGPPRPKRVLLQSCRKWTVSGPSAQDEAETNIRGRQNPLEYSH